MNTFTRVARQPMIHFLLLALVLFGAYNLLNGDKELTPQHIRIDDKALLTYFQYRSRAFNDEQAREKLMAMSSAEKAHMINNLIREEALYREALAMGMDREDYVIKQRLVQKMEYLARGFGLEDAELPKSTVETYYKDHAALYTEAPTATFTHVFIKAEDGDNAAMEKAEALLRELNDQQIPFSKATGYGDRFIYHSNYVERDNDLVASHFGDGLSKILFGLTPDKQQWQGPLRSRYGLHLVLLTDTSRGGLPPLDSIYSRVADDARQWLVNQQADKAIADMIDQYRVEVTVAGFSPAPRDGGTEARSHAASQQH